MALVAHCDYMVTNDLFNLLLAQQQHPGDKAIAAEIAAKLQKVRFGDVLALRTLNGDGTPIAYTFTPAPAEQVAGEDIGHYRFPKQAPSPVIPNVTVQATLVTRAFAFIPNDRKADQTLLGPTPFWPSDDAEIRQLAAQITAGAATPEAKVQKLLDWLLPGAHLKYDGPVVGSRYGTKQVLAQGFGHCWDFSDVFVTLCRAAGIPCRQVAGWLYGTSGHVWAEVLIDGKGWQQVDPTAGMACDTHYLAYCTTETGEMPLLYVENPQIEQVDR
jgi:transglutaminase-like putative cysteine protease